MRCRTGRFKKCGVITAKIKSDSFASEVFSRLNSASVETIAPLDYFNFEFQFEPKAEKVEKIIVQYKTLHNPYEN